MLYSKLKDYFDDVIAEESKNDVLTWLSNTEHDSKYRTFLKLLWDEMSDDDDGDALDLESTLYKIHYRINHKSKKGKVGSSKVKSKPAIQFHTILRVAARIAAIIMLPVLGYLGWEVFSEKLWMKNQAEVVFNEIVCPLGSRSHFELPDGTTGNLNNGSRLKYPVRFSGKTREVELVGEAFFDVHHNRSRPFIINTDGLDVKVLGTRLNVHSYPGEYYQEFTLESGSIELIDKNNDQEISIARMNPGQHAVYRTDKFSDHHQLKKEEKTINRITDKKEFNTFLKNLEQGQLAVYELEEGKLDVAVDETSKYTAWKEGKLVLRRDPMPILLARIERWYNVKFNILDNRILEYTYWVTFEEENLDQVLELLALTGPIEFQKLPKVQLPDGTFKVQEINIQLRN